MARSLRFVPAQLQATAESLSSHAHSFTVTHAQAHSRATSVALGTGKAAAALPTMLNEWQNSAVQFARRHIKHADGHAAAAAAYTKTDRGAADVIEAAGLDL
jgi:hypothetical protein